MKIVLLEHIKKLGQMGDIVDVKSGYARNFLLPFHKALRATEKNIKYFDEQKTVLKAKNLENIKEAESVKAKLDGKSFILIRSASDTGALYGSVSSKDIKEVASTDGIVISKNQISLEKPIKELGIYKINVLLHPDISSEILINVARTTDEAKLQEKGKDLSDTKLVEATEDNIEIKNMFDDVSIAEKISNEEINSANEDNIEGSNESAEKNEQKVDTSSNLSKPEVKDSKN
tara:strand:+ start:347 stop:1042 length:696 start_codon:yes stop_codon:yes gene_type:complete